MQIGNLDLQYGNGKPFVLNCKHEWADGIKSGSLQRVVCKCCRWWGWRRDGSEQVTLYKDEWPRGT